MVYLFLADGFEEIEAVTPIDLLRRAKIDVTTVGVGKKAVTSSRGLIVTADVTADEARFDNLEAAVYPGGYPGYKNIMECPDAKALAQRCAHENKPLAAICAAPAVVMAWGLLSCGKATVYPSMKEALGEKYVDERVVWDAPFLTANAAGASAEFAIKLIEVLRGEKAAKDVADSICL